jgi:hypothetical protein
MQRSLRTDSDWMAFDPWSSVPLRSLRSLCGSPFLIGVLHTEIAKIAKNQFGLDGLRSVVVRSFAFFAISVWIAFSDRNFTHGDRKDR